ncbi:MAG TPA: ATP-binding cassette domain-containing protein [Burkholderiaceae bacterium]|nr:ATP-binding cassette domain-containing protein [Burkholderiaceae bacterium]
MLDLANVSVSIGTVGILRGVTLQAPAGKFVGLIGRNGAGKTTLMRTIMGLLPCRDGGIAFDGRDLARIPTHERVSLGIGYMPEDRRLVPALTVEENVLMPAWAARLPDAPRRLEQVWQVLPELQGFRLRKALQLSGGQQKLVALARALIVGDRLLLLDEPFEGVAPALARRLAEVIAGLRSAGRTVLVSESSLTHTQHLLDASYTIDRGQIVGTAY